MKNCMAGSLIRSGKVTLTISWLARIWSLASIGFVLLIIVGELLYPHAPLPDTVRDWAGLLSFPVGTCLGLILVWRREGLGGGITVGSLLVFTW